MAREINLTDIGDHFSEKVQTVVRKATLKATKDIKEFIKGYPELVAKQLEQFIRNEFGKA